MDGPYYIFCSIKVIVNTSIILIRANKHITLDIGEKTYRILRTFNYTEALVTNGSLSILSKTDKNTNTNMIQIQIQI